MKKLILITAMFVSLQAVGQNVSTATPILQISAQPAMTRYYQIIISDSSGVIHAYKENGKWVINDAEKAIEALLKHADNVAKYYRGELE